MDAYTYARQNILLPVIFSTLALCFTTASSRLDHIATPTMDNEMLVALPKYMQVILAGGDRYLAANINTFRALISNISSKSPNETLKVQAKIQSDAAWLNPYHEDNYYLAAATLPWNGMVEQAQYILASASHARNFDMLPPFFYAFNQYYFEHDPLRGSDWLKIAATHTDDLDQKFALQKLAARWIEKGEDHRQALKMLETMAAQSNIKSVKQNLLVRAERVRHLISLDDASNEYLRTYNTLPTSIEDLTKTGVLKHLLQDPLGDGYILDANGRAKFMPKAEK